MRAPTMLSILTSVLLCSCSSETVLSRPVRLPVEIPENLRQCAERAGTDPSTFQTRGDLLAGYGAEQARADELQDCHRETIRLVDVHNRQATTPPAAAGEKGKKP